MAIIPIPNTGRVAMIQNACQRESHAVTKSIVMIVVLVRVNLFINLYAVSGFISHHIDL